MANITQYGKAANDYVKLAKLRYDSRGGLILPPNGTALLDYLWRDTGNNLHLRNNYESFIEANGAVHLAANAYYDYLAGNWNRLNTASTSLLLVAREAPTPQLELWTAAAGANPIAWTGPTVLTRTELARLVTLATITGVTSPLTLAAGALGIQASTAVVPGSMSAADKAKLDAATSAYTASALAQRDANGDLAGAAWNAINAAGGAAPAFSTNWSNLAGSQAVQYRKAVDKRIVLRGSCTKSIAVVNGETLFTLPVGFRPAAALSFPIGSFNATPAPILAGVSISSAGVVQLYGGVANQVSFANVQFYTD